MAARSRTLVLVALTGLLLCAGVGLAATTHQTAPHSLSQSGAGVCGPTSSVSSPDQVGGLPLGWSRRWVASDRSVTDSQGQVWEPDAAVARGGMIRPAARSIAGTGTPALYRHERTGVTQYALPVPTAGRWIVVVYAATAVQPFDVTAGSDIARVRVGVAGVRQVALVASTSASVLTVAFSVGAASVNAIAVGLAGPAADTWSTRFCDDFAGSAGRGPDARKWRHETGPVGSWDGQLQTYTDRPANAGLDGRGHLSVVARRERMSLPDGTVRNFTSARLNSMFAGRYGRISARIQVPAAAGGLAAFWMLGADLPDVGWPECGEIDILESLGAARPGVVYGTLHGPDGSGGGWQSGAAAMPAAGSSAAFHEYSVDWWPGIIQIAADGVVYAAFTPADLSPGQRWSFDRPAYILLSFAVGGSWAGAPAASSPFPQVMLVDSVIWRN
ncbi:glycoside hydrolase family 16 protein [Dactylosporangium sp. CA-092794]|uniref:glycoside hydrolase family 16 protein n=1 Tax=Dactylosporangium sp. CA-092794 TaxID=3239929 RepID=UPI003D8D6798